MGHVAKVLSVAPMGFDGSPVVVECDITKGLPALSIVGLTNKSIDEAKDRVRSALANSLLEYPARRITVNLAPAEIAKDGTHYDLPIALAVLCASNQLLPKDIEDAVFAGELALDGAIRPVSGIITIAETARDMGVSTLYIPEANITQALLVEGITIIGLTSLTELILHLKGERTATPAIPAEVTTGPTAEDGPFLDDVIGQEKAKRALVIAAAGGHNILLTGPPGAGKTMLAKVLRTLLPPLSADERLTTTKLHSLAGLQDQVIVARPFRSPHHTSSQISLIGGGTRPRPGEISLAHHGVLFLDEMPEFPRSLLESLRQPLEDRSVSVSRASGKATYPADFILIGTMNPCPCGYYGDSQRECSCSSTQILNYQKRLSGPLLDRIDMIVSVGRMPNKELLQVSSMSKDQHYMNQKMIQIARQLQHNRYGSSTKNNNSLTSHEVKHLIQLSPDVELLLTKAADALALSPRSYFKLIKVARTIADLNSSPDITTAHLSEAIQYR